MIAAITGDDAPIYRGETVTLSYTDPTPGDDARAIQDTDGHDTNSFDMAVTNGSTRLAKPRPPTGLTAIGEGETRIDLSWKAPVRTGGRIIQGYQIEAYLDGSDTWRTLVARHTATSYSDTGLEAGTTRHYRVRAISAVGTSDASETASGRTDGGTSTGCQPADLWCGVLVVKDLGFENRGCNNSSQGKKCSDSAVLSKDEITHGEETYQFHNIDVESDTGRLSIGLETDFPSDSDGWALHVGTDTFNLADADSITSKLKRWNNTGLSWETDDIVTHAAP